MGCTENIQTGNHNDSGCWISSKVLDFCPNDFVYLLQVASSDILGNL